MKTQALQLLLEQFIGGHTIHEATDHWQLMDGDKPVYSSPSWSDFTDEIVQMCAYEIQIARTY